MTEELSTELVVVRHGETEWNLAGRQQGHMDSPLTELGQRQAAALAERLAGEHFDVLYSSDLGRAMRTAECIARTTGLAVVPESGLRERNLGIMQGLTYAEVEQQYPEVFGLFRSGDPDYVLPSGESSRERYERHVRTAVEIAARHVGGRVLLVAHGGVLASLFRFTLAIDLEQPRRFKLYNASLNSFCVRGKDWRLGTWGDISHLRGIGSCDDT
jgi:2,3-bisphosphoglycerate-dependent phosphoglycerate mutase